MKKILTAFVIILAMATAFSCGSSTVVGGGGATQGYLGGDWSGTWHSKVGTCNGVLFVTLSQDGLTVTGIGYMTDKGIKYTGSGTGTVTNASGPGNIVLGMAYSAANLVMNFVGAYTATTITGTYTDSEGDHGIFTVVKQ